MKRKRVEKVLVYINLPRFVACHLFGENHNLKHRMSVGMVIMIVGVVISKAGATIHVFQLHIFLDAIGYFLHALGGTPFIEHFLSEFKGSSGVPESSEDLMNQIRREVDKEVEIAEEKEEVADKKLNE